jgi:AraC-like DNA-binding protein
VSLEWLSEQLGATRHNTSQVIDEHFNMNFFELINKFRIGEAKEMLRDDNYKNLSIIQVAYEVGFNNKVTFNKSFKKYLEQTPSQYIKSIRA